MRSSFRSLPKTVWMLGLVSFFTDLSSEMIYPLLPVFLTQVLSTGALALGLIEGIAESTAAFFKVASGSLTDRFRKRKPFILFGYGLAGAVRPLMGMASSWPMVAALRFTDRIGKGLRTSPRDALLADAVSEDRRGEAYGFHRAMDHAGAVAGPLIAALLLSKLNLPLRQVFLWAAIPALISFLILVVGVSEAPAPQPKESFSWSSLFKQFSGLDGGLKKFLAVLLIFTLGNSTDAFLLLRLREAGVSVGVVALLWSIHHLIKMASTAWAGRHSDRRGRVGFIVGGWVYYALMYFGFAALQSPGALIAVFLAYGLYFGLTEPTERALVADLSGERSRGTAFGCYHFVIGLAALPASLLFGFLWQRFGSATAFCTGAALALAASLGLAVLSQEFQGRQSQRSSANSSR